MQEPLPIGVECMSVQTSQQMADAVLSAVADADADFPTNIPAPSKGAARNPGKEWEDTSSMVISPITKPSSNDDEEGPSRTVLSTASFASGKMTTEKIWIVS